MNRNTKYAAAWILLLVVTAASFAGIVIHHQMVVSRQSPHVYMTDEHIAAAQRQQDSDEPQLTVAPPSTRIENTNRKAAYLMQNLRIGMELQTVIAIAGETGTVTGGGQSDFKQMQYDCSDGDAYIYLWRRTPTTEDWVVTNVEYLHLPSEPIPNVPLPKNGTPDPNTLYQYTYTR